MPKKELLTQAPVPSLKEDRLILLEKLARELYSPSTLFEASKSQVFEKDQPLFKVLLNHSAELAELAMQSLLPLIGEVKQEMKVNRAATASNAMPAPTPSAATATSTALASSDATAPARATSTAPSPEIQFKKSSPRLSDPALISALMKLRKQRELYASRSKLRPTRSSIPTSPILKAKRPSNTES